ncbi:hypothetical protein QNM99_14145 [Pseudomonas sp. PCH446]
MNIGPAVKSLASEVAAFEGQAAVSRDFVLGNTKARMRMVAQYTIAGAAHGLVIGTDHAAEAVMAFSPNSVTVPVTWPLERAGEKPGPAIARHFGAPEFLVEKVPTADLEDLARANPTKPPTASPIPRSTPSCTASRYARKLSISFVGRTKKPSTNVRCHLRRDLFGGNVVGSVYFSA